MKRIACVIVTYNRKAYLKRCLYAIISQSIKPHTVFITDNASNDGTIDSVKQWGFYNSEVNGIKFSYILNKKNEGGAGGFYLGMKTAHETDSFDAFWLMDDDGEPEARCLELLSRHSNQYHYIAPLVISDEDRNTCSFTKNHETYTEFAQKANEGLVLDFASPFNGILISSELVSKVGYPKKEMFIWGDENNFHSRCIIHGYKPICVVDAIHYHPIDRQIHTKYRGVELVKIEADWKLYCFVRNKIYNYYHLRPYLFHNTILRVCCQIKYLFSMWRTLYIIAEFDKKQFKKNRSLIVYKAGVAGLIGYFGGLDSYLIKP